MTSPTYPVWCGDGGAHAPKRPTANDMGGILFECPIECPPNQKRRPPWRGYIQALLATERLCRMVPLLSVDFRCSAYPSSGTPLCVNSVADGITISNVTINRVAHGQYQLTWPSGLLPSTTRAPLVKSVDGERSQGGSATQTGSACIVTCYDNTGGPADSTVYAFNVAIWGET